MKVYEVRQLGIENLVLVERAEPQPRANEAVVKFQAASLNYRDLMFVRGVYNPRARLPCVPFSDGSGEVVAVGADVKKCKVGDRVCPIFMQAWIEGSLSIEKRRTRAGSITPTSARSMISVSRRTV